MLTLSSTLLAAQKRQDVDPQISALVSDNPPEAPRLSELTLVYAGAEYDAPNDSCFTAAGTIGRIFLASQVVKAQVIDPGVGGWDVWSLVLAGQASTPYCNQVALWGSQTDGKVWAFWVASDNRTINMAIWDGAAWGSTTLVYAMLPGHVVTGLAADGMDPTPRLYFTETYGFIYETHWTGSAWSAPLGDGVTWNGYPVISVGFRPTSAPGGLGDAFVIISSDSPTKISVKQFGITSFSGWGSSSDLLAVGAGTGYAYNFPKLSEARSDSLRAVVTWSETAPAPMGIRTMIGFTPTHSSVQGAVPWRYTSAFGMKVFRDRQALGKWWFVGSANIYSAPADGGWPLPAGQRVSFARDQIRSLRLETGQPNTRSRAVLTVLNQDGYLSQAGKAGSYRALRAWSQVAIALGYRSPSGGLETAWQIPLWIDGIVFHDEARTGEPLVSLHLVDTWAVLETLRFRSTLTYSGKTVEYIAQRCLWHVCGFLGSLGAPLNALTLATFTIRAGEQVAVVLNRLCRLVGVELVFRTLSSSVDGTGFDSVGVVAVVQGLGSSVYSYGPASHPIGQGDVEVVRAPRNTGIAVAGATTQSFARNWGPTWLLWRDVLERIVDKTLATQAATDLVATDEAQAMLTGLAGGTITVVANVGQEVGDVVDVTIPSSGLVAQAYAVSGMVMTWSDPGSSGQLLQRLELEAHA